MNLILVYLNGLLQYWNDIFFHNQSTVAISVFRLLTGILVFLDTLSWFKLSKNFLSPDGWFGYDEYRKHFGKFRFSIFNYLPATLNSVKWVLLIQAGAGICLALGLFASMSALICFITLVSIHNRNIYVLSSGDTALRFFSLFLIFVPSGSQITLLNFFQLSRSEVVAWLWPLIMIKLFMANIYLKNVWFKLLGISWRDGTATQKVFRVRIWNRVQIPAWLDNTWFYRITNYGTLLIETALFTLVWIDEYRLAIILAGMLFHVGLWYFLRIGYFQLTMIAGLTTFIKPEEYERFFTWIKQLG